MNVRRIRTDADYEEALAEVQRLWEAKPGTPEEAKLDVIAMLVHHYERAGETLPALNPVEAIKFRMEQQGLSRKDLLPVFGTTARVSEVLNGKRSLTLGMIRKLHGLFAIPLESLITPAVMPKPTKKRMRTKRPRLRTTRPSATPTSVPSK